MALPEVECYNPAFDVTDHTLISGIVTEYGICRAAVHREPARRIPTKSTPAFPSAHQRRSTHEHPIVQRPHSDDGRTDLDAGLGRGLGSRDDTITHVGAAQPSDLHWDREINLNGNLSHARLCQCAHALGDDLPALVCR